MRKCLLLSLILCLLAACGGESSPTPDLVATQIAIEVAARATMTAWTPTATDMPVPTETAVPTEPPSPTPVPSKTPTPRPTVTPPPSVEAEEYAVYSDMIQQNPINFNLGTSILIRENTVSNIDSFERALEYADPLPAGLEDSYRSRNAASYTLEPNLDVELDYATMPEEEFQKLMRRGGLTWAEFHEEYPEASGIVSFSRVGFSTNEEEALALMGFLCGDLCGSGGLYRLVKEDGTWTVQDTLMAWIH